MSHKLLIEHPGAMRHVVNRGDLPSSDYGKASLPSSDYGKASQREDL